MLHLDALNRKLHTVFALKYIHVRQYIAVCDDVSYIVYNYVLCVVK